MPRNVEIKARIGDVTTLTEKARVLCKGASPVLLEQHDVFFRSPQGRLKLRAIIAEGQEKWELIWYDRPDTEGPKLSDFRKTDLTTAELANAIKETLRFSMGVLGEVKKRRTLFIYEQTRIHIDHVDGLGDYMELEVCLREEQTLEEGEAIAERIREKLGVRVEDLCSGAYMDALNK